MNSVAWLVLRPGAGGVFPKRTMRVSFYWNLSPSCLEKRWKAGTSAAATMHTPSTTPARRTVMERLYNPYEPSGLRG